MGSQRLSTSQVRQSCRSEENARRTHMGTLRWWQHLPCLPSSHPQRRTQHGQVRPWCYRGRNIRLRCHRPSIHSLQQPLAARKPSVFGHHREESHRLCHGGTESRLPVQRLAATRGDFPQSIAANDFLHHHREGLQRGSSRPGTRTPASAGNG